jgi:hypothetical protein
MVSKSDEAISRLLPLDANFGVDVAKVASPMTPLQLELMLLVLRARSLLSPARIVLGSGIDAVTG